MTIRLLQTHASGKVIKDRDPFLPFKPTVIKEKATSSGGLWSEFKSFASLAKAKGKEAAEIVFDSLKKFDSKISDLDFIESLREKNTTLLDHRLKHLALFPPAFYKAIAEKNEEQLDRLESMLESGIPLETGIKIIKPLIKDPHLKLFLDLELKENSASPEDLKHLLLDTAEKLEESDVPFDGAWPMAAELYEEILKEEKEKIRGSFTPGELAHVHATVENEVWKRVAPAAAERISALKKEDPEAFFEHYPSGEMPREEFLALVDRAVTENSEWIEKRCDLELNKLVMAEIDAKAERGELPDVATTAWEKYDRMMDPLDKWKRFSDESYDELGDQIATTVATMPLSLGAGALARAGASWILSASVRTGLPLLVAEGLALGSGSCATGVTMEAIDSKLKDRDFEAEKALHNAATDLIFQGSGKLWGRFAEKLGITGKAAYEAGAFTTSALATTGATYANPDDARALSERMADSAVAMAPFHVGMKFLNAATGNLLGKIEAWGSKKLSDAALSTTYEILKPPPRLSVTVEKTAKIIDIDFKETNMTPEGGAVEKPFLLPARPKSTETKMRIPIALGTSDTTPSLSSSKEADATKVGRPGGISLLKEGSSPSAKPLPFEKAMRPLTLVLDKYAINATIKSKKVPELSYLEDGENKSIEVKVANWDAAEPVLAELRALTAKGKLLSIDLPDLKSLKERGVMESEGEAILKSGASELKAKLRWVLRPNPLEIEGKILEKPLSVHKVPAGCQNFAP